VGSIIVLIYGHRIHVATSFKREIINDGSFTVNFQERFYILNEV
jgi:hypothetical protein